MSDAVSEAVLEAERRRDRLSGFVAVMIALATLVAACAGYLQADASNGANDRRLAAEQLSLAALAGAQQGQQRAQVHYQTFARFTEQRTAAGNAMLRSLYAEAGSSQEAGLLREQERWEQLAASTAELTEITLDGELGPQQDPAFPARYFANATYESLRLNALQDAANEEALHLEGRVASLTAVLAMLAVSLYLLGLTLAVNGRWLQLGFLGVGLALFAAAAGWSLLVVAQPVPAADEEAAEAYARSRVALETAVSDAGYEEAVAHYSRAIELRPTFARAYAERADAIFLAATPQRTGFASIVPPDALQRSRADLQRAHELGLESASTLGSLGFYAFVEGVQAADHELLEDSIGFSQRAIERDPGEPVYRFNLAVTLAAADRLSEAEAAYREAVGRALYLDDGRTERRAEPFIEEAWVAGALTDLEIVLSHRPDLEAEIRRMKELIVGPISAGTLEPPPPSPARFTDLALSVFPTQVQWEGTLADYDAARDVVSVQWYHRGADGLGWAVIPEISRPAGVGTGPDGRLYQLSSYMGAVHPPACLPAGEYRAEIYVNGRLAGVGQAEPHSWQSTAAVARDLTLAFCRPPEWQPMEDRLPGLIDGYLAADGERGVYAARYGLPRSLGRLPAISTEMMRITIESFAERFPATPRHVEEWGTTNEYFMGLGATAWRWYDFGTGYVRAGAGLSPDGAVVVALVYGPYDWFETTEPYQILNSFVTYE